MPPNVGQIAKDSILYLSVFPLVDGIVSYCVLFIVGVCCMMDSKNFFIDHSGDNRDDKLVIDDHYRILLEYFYRGCICNWLQHQVVLKMNYRPP